MKSSRFVVFIAGIAALGGMAACVIGYLAYGPVEGRQPVLNLETPKMNKQSKSTGASNNHIIERAEDEPPFVDSNYREMLALLSVVSSDGPVYKSLSAVEVERLNRIWYQYRMIVLQRMSEHCIIEKPSKNERLVVTGMSIDGAAELEQGFYKEVDRQFGGELAAELIQEGVRRRTSQSMLGWGSDIIGGRLIVEEREGGALVRMTLSSQKNLSIESTSVLPMHSFRRLYGPFAEKVLSE